MLILQLLECTHKLREMQLARFAKTIFPGKAYKPQIFLEACDFGMPFPPPHTPAPHPPTVLSPLVLKRKQRESSHKNQPKTAI